MTFRFVVLDFETSSAVDLKKVGAHRYAEDMSTEIVCLGFHEKGSGFPPRVMQGGELAARPSALSQLVFNEKVIFVAHNAGFEKAIWRSIMVKRFGWPDIPNTRWHDTMAVCAMKALPLRLETAAKVLRLPNLKHMEGHRAMLKAAKPGRSGDFDMSPGLMEQVQAYNKCDVLTESDLLASIGFLSKNEHQVWLMDQTINERGILIDREFVDAALEVVAQATTPMVKRFHDLTGGLKPTQVKETLTWLHARGVHLDNLQKATIAEFVGRDVDEAGEEVRPGHTLPEEAREVLQIRQSVASASIKKLNAMRACAGDDGRIRGTLQYHGATPGRWAGRLLQPQNFPRPALKLDDDAPDPEILVSAIMSRDAAWVADLFGDPIQAVVSSLRHAIIAPAGKMLLSGDYSTIEARIVLALAGQRDKVEMLAAGVDPYIDMAQAIYKCKVDKKKDPEKRQIGKNSVLGLGFQMGPPKFQLKYCPDQPFEFAQKVVATYRTEWAPEVPKLWRAIEDAALRTVKDRRPHEAYGIVYAHEDRWLTARLPSGRKLWYFNPQLTRKRMPWDETDVRLAWTYQAMKMGQWKTIDAYGGHLTENAVQATARDLLVDAMLRTEAEGLPLVFSVHDEEIAEVEEARADTKMLAQLMADVPQWAKAAGIPVAASCWTGRRYRK